MSPRLLITIISALVLSACATVQKFGAANDIHAFLVSIRDDDRAAFEAHVDRKALASEIEQRLLTQTHKPKADKGLQALGALLAPSLAQMAGDALVQPRIFRTAAEYYGYKPSTPIPNAIAISGSLKSLPDGRVCATKSKDGPCVLIFTQENGTWRLSGFDGDLSMFQIKL